MVYEFEVIGDIKGKARPRVNTYTCKAYTPTNTKDYEELIKQYFKIKYPKYIPLENRVSVKIVAYFKIPKNTSKKNAENMLKGSISPTKKPDIDNIVKGEYQVLIETQQFSECYKEQCAAWDSEKNMCRKVGGE